MMKGGERKGGTVTEKEIGESWPQRAALQQSSRNWLVVEVCGM